MQQYKFIMQSYKRPKYHLQTITRCTNGKCISSLLCKSYFRYTVITLNYW